MARSKEFEESVVLDKALRLFWEQGYEKTSMTDLVKHMGIHRRSLYDTFGDKRSLYLKVMDRFGEKINVELSNGINHSKTATEALHFVFEFMIRLNVEENLPPGCLMVNSAVELAMRDINVDKKSINSFVSTEQKLKEIILWGQENEEFASEFDAEEWAEYLNSVLIGLRVMARTSVTKEKLNHITNMTIKLLEK